MRHSNYFFLRMYNQTVYIHVIVLLNQSRVHGRIKREGEVIRFLPPGISQVANGFLRNTGMDPPPPPREATHEPLGPIAS